VDDQTGRLSPVKAGFACGSVKKNGLFRPAAGDIPRQTRDRRMHGSSGRFAVFAHVVVFVVQTPTA
jgi:hypothetical protein